MHSLSRLMIFDLTHLGVSLRHSSQDRKQAEHTECQHQLELPDPERTSLTQAETLQSFRKLYVHVLISLWSNSGVHRCETSS